MLLVYKACFSWLIQDLALILAVLFSVCFSPGGFWLGYFFVSFSILDLSRGYSRKRPGARYSWATGWDPEGRF